MASTLTDLYRDLFWPKPKLLGQSLTLDGMTAEDLPEDEGLPPPEELEPYLEAEEPPPVPAAPGPMAGKAEQVARYGSPDAKRALALERAQAIAGLQLPQGQMVGDVYVRPSPLLQAGVTAAQIFGSRLQRKMAGPEPDRGAAAEAALQLPEDERAAALLLSGDPGFRQAGTVMMQSGGQAAAAAQRDAMARARMEAQQKKDAEALAFRQAEAQRAQANADRMYRLQLAMQKWREKKAEAATGTPNAPKLTEAQMKQGRHSAEGATATEAALEAGFPDTDLGGAPEAAGWAAARAGLQAFVPAEWEERAAFWQDAMEPLLRARTGAAMQNEEFKREAMMLIPQPGESVGTHIRKAQKLVAHMQSGLVGIPEQVAAPIRARLETLAASLPKTEDDYKRMKAGGRAATTPGPAAAPAAGAAVPPPAPSGELPPGWRRSKSGKPIHQVNGKWEYGDPTKEQ